MNLIALSGRAAFDVHDVAHDVEATTKKDRGPHYAWMLFTWKVNEMVPETFATKEDDIEVEFHVPAKGWVQEKYKRARILHPPEDSGSKLIVQADDVRLFPVWDVAMQQVVAGNIHSH